MQDETENYLSNTLLWLRYLTALAVTEWQLIRFSLELDCAQLELQLELANYF